jgi:hypothetical protein
MADVHLFGGEKGGIGKSFVCRTAIQYLLDRDEVFALFDTDRSNPDVRRIYNEAGCRVAVFSEGERYEDKANAIYNAALEKRVLVNLPAQVFIPVKEWFERNELLSIANDDGVKFFYWFVCDGGYDSLKLLGKSLEFFKSDVPHILVKNWGKCDDWEPLENDDYLQSLMAQYEVNEFFVIFVALGQLQVLIEDSPSEWKDLFEEFREELGEWATTNVETLSHLTHKTQTMERLAQSSERLGDTLNGLAQVCKGLIEQLQASNLLLTKSIGQLTDSNTNLTSLVNQTRQELFEEKKVLSYIVSLKLWN